MRNDAMLEIGGSDAGNSMQVIARAGIEELHVSITDTGFGYTTTITLNAANVLKLKDFIYEWLIL